MRDAHTTALAAPATAPDAALRIEPNSFTTEYDRKTGANVLAERAVPSLVVFRIIWL